MNEGTNKICIKKFYEHEPTLFIANAAEKSYQMRRKDHEKKTQYEVDVNKQKKI